MCSSDPDPPPQIILLLSDMSFVDMTTNLVLNLAALGMEHYLVVATEPAVCMRFAAEGVVTGCESHC